MAPGTGVNTTEVVALNKSPSSEHDAGEDARAAAAAVDERNLLLSSTTYNSQSDSGAGAIIHVVLTVVVQAEERGREQLHRGAAARGQDRRLRLGAQRRVQAPGCLCTGLPARFYDRRQALRRLMGYMGRIQQRKDFGKGWQRYFLLGPENPFKALRIRKQHQARRTTCE